MIQLAEFDESDIPRLISWIDSKETLIQFAGTAFDFPLEFDQFVSNLNEENRNVYKAIVKDQVIGHAELLFNSNHSVKICRVFIGENKERGKGYGTEIMKKLVQLSFDEFKVREIELNVYEWNITAIKLYEKLGFKHTSKYSESPIVNGRIWKGLNMELKIKEYL